jgi:hypothetical protein
LLANSVHHSLQRRGINRIRQQAGSYRFVFMPGAVPGPDLLAQACSQTLFMIAS